MQFSPSNTFASAVLICALVSPVLSAQASVPDETTTITLDQAVHFIGTDGSDAVAEPGGYSVEAAQEWLRLIPGTERRDALLIEAQPGTHDVKVEIPIVISTPGTELDETDIHVVQFLNPDGTSLMATGTYSGIQSRGLRDRARQAATRARARAEAARRVAAAKAQQTANAARAAALQAKQAAEDLGQEAKLRLEDRKRQLEIQATLAKQVLLMPKLSQAQKNILVTRAKEVLEQNKPMLQELALRIKNNRALLVKMARTGPQNLSPAEIQNFRQVIIGTGDKMLRLSTWPKEGNLAVAAGQPVSRGIIENGASFSLGGSVDASAIIGAGFGAFIGLWPLPPPLSWPLLPQYNYTSAEGSLGAQGGVSANLDIGLWNSWPNDLGGCDYAVQAAGGAAVATGLSVVFQGIPGGNFRFSGISIDPGAGLEFSAAIVAGCAIFLGTT